MELYELKNLCADMAELGAARQRQHESPAADLISQREAYRLFGETRVKRWKDDGLITAVRLGTTRTSKRQYSRVELMAVEKAERLQPIVNQRSSA